MKENGLKRIFRFLGIKLSKQILNISNNINPNHITITSFLTVLIGIMSLFLYDMGIFFIFCILFALVLDYADGEYARATSQTSKNGHYLDSMLDILKISSVYLSLYFYYDNIYIKDLMFLNIILFMIFLWSKIDLLKLDIKKTAQHKEGSYLKANLFFGYSLVHHYLYISIFLLLDSYYILILPLLFGISLSIKNYKSIFLHD